MKIRKLPLLIAGVLFVAMCFMEALMKPPANIGRIGGNGSSIYALAGEFRTVFANLLWIKADTYHHEFLNKNPDWSQNRELIGLLKLIVDLDPHFEEAYASGSYIYVNAYHSPEKAITFLKDGLKNNPDSWDLNRVAALIYAINLHDYNTALVHARKARTYCQDAFNRRIMTRLVSTLERKVQEKTATGFSHQG